MDNENANGFAMVPSHQLSPELRLKRFQQDDEALDELVQHVHKKAMGDGPDANPAGHLECKLREQRALLWGLYSPTRHDMVMLDQQRQPKQADKIRAVLTAFMDRMPPEQKLLRQRLEQMSASEALERLGLPSPDAPPLTVPEDDSGGSIDGKSAA